MPSRTASTRRPRGKSIQRAYEIRDSIRAARRPPQPPVTFDKADLARAFGFNVLDPGAEREDSRRFAEAGAHESAHALIAAVTGIHFAKARVESEGIGGVWLYEDTTHGDVGPVADRVAFSIAGICAEQHAFGAADSVGCWPDLQLACAHADGNVELVRQQIARTRSLLIRHEAGLWRLASALLEARELTADACRGTLRSAGVDMPPARFSPYGPPEEEARIAATEQAIEAHERALAEVSG